MLATFDGMAKKQFNFRLEQSLVEQLQKLAEKDNRTLTNYIETVLINHIKESKNKKS